MALSHLALTVGGNTPLDKRAACPETTLTSITLQKAPARRGITPPLWIVLKSTSKVCRSGSLLKFQRKARPTVFHWTRRYLANSQPCGPLYLRLLLRLSLHLFSSTLLKHSNA